MIKRSLDTLIKTRLKGFPAVAVLGPRQSGKTTLAKNYSSTYYDLELDSEQLRLDLEWEKVTSSEKIAILDEAQNYPDIFPRIKNAIDTKRSQNGRFLILGSVSPALMKNVSEFLTGRVALCELAPFSILELKKKSENDQWLMGGFPDGGILKRAQFPVWQNNYLDLLAMRDLPLWGMPATPQTTQRFFKMLAVADGTIWNASQIGKSMGLSYHTVNTYLDYIQQAYLARKLPPYSPNIKKRLVKSPKIYWRDSGLLHSLMGVESLDSLLVQPWVGASWEGWVIDQILVALRNAGKTFDAYYFRTADGYELDLVLELAGEVWAFETKLSASVGRNDVERVKKAASLVDAQKVVLLCRTKKETISRSFACTNLKGALRLLLN